MNDQEFDDNHQHCQQSYRQHRHHHSDIIEHPLPLLPLLLLLLVLPLLPLVLQLQEDGVFIIWCHVCSSGGHWSALDLLSWFRVYTAASRRSKLRGGLMYCSYYYYQLHLSCS